MCVWVYRAYHNRLNTLFSYNVYRSLHIITCNHVNCSKRAKHHIYIWDIGVAAIHLPWCAECTLHTVSLSLCVYGWLLFFSIILTTTNKCVVIAEPMCDEVNIQHGQFFCAFGRSSFGRFFERRLCFVWRSDREHRSKNIHLTSMCASSWNRMESSKRMKERNKYSVCAQSIHTKAQSVHIKCMQVLFVSIFIFSRSLYLLWWPWMPSLCVAGSVVFFLLFLHPSNSSTTFIPFT